MVGSNVLEEFLLEFKNFRGNKDIEVSLDTSEDNADLLLSLHGGVLVLLEHFNESFTSVQKFLSGGIEIRTECKYLNEILINQNTLKPSKNRPNSKSVNLLPELRESGKFSVLGESVLEGTSESLHGLDLSG